MDKPPRPPSETILGAGLWQRIPRVGAVIAALTPQLAGVHLPPLQALLGPPPPTIADPLIVTALASLGYAAIRLDRLLRTTKSPSPSTATTTT